MRSVVVVVVVQHLVRGVCRYYELLDQRRELKTDDVAIVRLEQLSPFPSELVAQELRRCVRADVRVCGWSRVTAVYWCDSTV